MTRKLPDLPRSDPFVAAKKKNLGSWMEGDAASLEPSRPGEQ
jgi:hypothetical protein